MHLEFVGKKANLGISIFQKKFQDNSDVSEFKK